MFNVIELQVYRTFLVKLWLYRICLIQTKGKLYLRAHLPNLSVVWRCGLRLADVETLVLPLEKRVYVRHLTID